MEEVFSYKITKDNKVFIFWHNKQIKILKGKESTKFMKRIEKTNEEHAQLIIAKITGNFKRGNEKLAKMNHK